MKVYKQILSIVLGFCITIPMFARNHRDTLGFGDAIHFIENKNQWDSHILFRADLHKATVFLEKSNFTILLEDPNNPTGKNPIIDKNRNKKYRYHAYKIYFEGGNSTSIQGRFKEDTYENYFIGNNPEKWAARVPLFQEVYYQDLYPNIALKVHSASRGLKYDFIVNSGGDPSKINMHYEGVDAMRLQNGNLIVKTSFMDVVEMRPYAYQIIKGNEIPISCEYELKENRVGFRLGEYDKSQPLTIDPVLIFSTYTGSTADNWGTTATYDSHKNTYSAGLVFRQGYPTSIGAFDESYNGNADIGIIKLNATGGQRLYATYLGGMYADMPHSLYVNEYDELVILGTTGSSNFPVLHNAYSTLFRGGTPINYLGINGYSATIFYPNGSDIFVSRLSNDGTQLAASTFIGGSGNDGLNYKHTYSNNNYDIIFAGNDSLYCNYGDGARGELITDDLNNIYVGTCTFSSDFPVTINSFQPTYGGGQDGVVFKLDYNLSNLLWSSYLGGSGGDAIYSIDTDDKYNLYVCGGTNSVNFPTTSNAYQTTYAGGGADGFITKISYYGDKIVASSLFGSDSTDQAYFVRSAKKGDAFIFGQTKALGSTMVHNANYNTPNSGQLLARFGPNLDTLIWSTVLGTGLGRANISPTAFAVDICNRVYAAGWGRDFCGYTIRGQQIPWNTYGTAGLQTSLNAIQTQTDGQDFYIFCMAEDASSLDYATFFGELHTSNNSGGGDHVDGGTSRFDKLGILYQSVCASCGGHQNFPTTSDAWDTVNRSSNCNNGIFKMSINEDFPVADFIVPRVGCVPETISFQNTGRGSSYYWDFGDNTNSTFKNPVHLYTESGIYTVTLIAYMQNGCKTSDTIQRKIMILGNASDTLETLYTCPGLPIQIGLRPFSGCTYRWINCMVSDPSISNPYVTISGSTVFTVIISNGICSDTLQQHVLMNPIDFDIVCDTTTCISPILFNVIALEDNLIYHFSSNVNFSDTLNEDMSLPNAMIYLSEPQYFYVRVTNSLGCFSIDSIWVEYNSIISPVHIQKPSCPHGCDGWAAVVPINATPPYDYSWSTGNTSDSLISDLCAGRYSVTVSDAEGCMSTQYFTIADPPIPVVRKKIQHAPCSGVCIGQIALEISDPVSNYTFLWLDDLSTSSFRENLCIGTYIVQITDRKGCIIFDTTEIVQSGLFSIESESQPVCLGECNGSATAIIQGGSNPYSYRWSDGQQTQQAIDLCEGIYVVVVTDNDGCSVSDTVAIDAIRTFANMQVWADDTVIFLGESTQLHATPIPDVTYRWQPATTLTRPNATTTTATPINTTWYILTATDSNGCQYVDTLKITCIEVICDKPNIFIPNAFSPNGDGINDKVCFSGEWITSFHITIFARWGEKMFEAYNIDQCWDGTYNGKKCQAGVYMYVCEIECEGNQKKILKGDITLLQ